MSIWVLLLALFLVFTRKRGLIALLLLVNVISMPAKADWGIGIKYGLTKADVSQNALNQQLANSGVNATVTSLNDKSQAWSVDVTYRFEEGIKENWLLSLGYQNLGEFDAIITGQAIDPEQFQSLVAEVQPQSGYGWTSAIGYQYRIYDRLFLQGQLGLFSWKSESASQIQNTNLASSEVRNNGHDIFYSAELGYQLLDNIEASLLYQHYSLDKNDIELLGIGLKYYF